MINFKPVQANGISLLEEDTARSFEQDVQAPTQKLHGIETRVIGSATYDDRSYPMMLCTVSRVSNRPWILISAGVHGDEPAGVFAAQKFLAEYAASFTNDFQIAVLPCINPSGFELNKLETATGANLNRLFGIEGTQSEVASIERWLRSFSRCFRATFDLHEVVPNYRGEGFVEADNPRACYLYETQADPALRIGRRMINALPEEFEVCRWPLIYKDRNEDGVVSYPEGCGNSIYAEQTTLDAYLNAHYTQHSFTFETPTGWSMEKRVATHLIWLETALRLLSWK